MSCIETLREEHRLIRHMVGALERYLQRLNSEQQEMRHDLVLLVTFFREFADLVHHEKEEGVLIPELVRSGMSWDQGTIEEIRQEHNHERYLMQALRHASLQSKPWSADDRRHLCDVAGSFIEFMRQHIQKEEASLLPIAEAELSAEARVRLDRKLRQFDEAWEKSGEAAVIRNLARELLSRYPSQHPAEPAAAR